MSLADKMRVTPKEALAGRLAAGAYSRNDIAIANATMLFKATLVGLQQEIQSSPKISCC